MKSKADSAKEVRAVLDSLKSFLSEGAPKLREADTRATFIDPLLRALGYEAIGDIQREVYVKDTKEFLDYVLQIDGQARIGVEAKALKQSLTDADAGQVIQYCSILGIEWSIVTNGREWRVYHQFAKTDLAGKLLFNLDLAGWNSDSEFQSLFDQLWLASRDAFENSDGPLAWLRAQQLDASLRDALTNAASPEVKFLRKRLGEIDILATVEDVAAWFKGKLLDAPPIPAHEASAPPGIAEPKTKYVGATTVGPENYWLVPAGRRPNITGEQSLGHWLGAGMWGFWESTPGRKSVHTGDHVAFYTSDKKVRAIVAYATVAAPADLLIQSHEWPEPFPQDKPVYKLSLTGVEWLTTRHSLTDPALRATLDAFKGTNLAKSWGWFVVTTRRLSQADFLRLIGKG
jgi:hypothetical protein